MIRVVRVPEGATADGEGQGFDGAGEKMEGGRTVATNK